MPIHAVNHIPKGTKTIRLTQAQMVRMTIDFHALEFSFICPRLAKHQTRSPRPATDGVHPAQPYLASNPGDSALANALPANQKHLAAHFVAETGWFWGTRRLCARKVNILLTCIAILMPWLISANDYVNPRNSVEGWDTFRWKCAKKSRRKSPQPTTK